MMAQKQYPRSIPVGVVDPVSGNIIPLKLSPSGSLMVDLSEIETVQLNIPPGQEIPVTVGNAEAIPTKFLTPQEVKNAAGNPVDVNVANTDPIPVEFGSAPDVVIPGGVAVTNFPSGFEVSNFPSPLTDDVVAVAPVVGEKTITQTAAALFAGSSALANRQLMRVRNLSLDQQVLVGPSTVAGTGFPVEPGGEYLFKFNKAVAVPVYAISPGAAAKVRVMEA